VTASSRSAPPTADGRAPNREGSRRRDEGRTAVHSPHPHSPDPHGGRLTERLVAADRAGGLAAEAARLPAVALDGRGELPPPQFSRPEVARLLADGYRAQRG